MTDVLQEEEKKTAETEVGRLQSKAMEYFKTIDNLCILYEFVSKRNICKLVPTQEIRLQIYGTTKNPRAK